MKFQLIKPSLILAPYVKAFWFMEMDTDPETPYLYHSMADGHPELAFHYKGIFNTNSRGTLTKLPHSSIIGQSNQFSQKIANDNFGVFGAYLYPFVIPKLFSLPANELSNQIVDINLLLGKEAYELEDKMMLTVSNTERVKILSAFLEKKIFSNTPRDDFAIASVRYVLNSMGKTDVQSLAQKFTISTRQFERNFKIHSGFSPKIFTRITRFQSALSEFKNSHKSLTEIAYDCGYYDQSHFIHDFREFSGIYPRQYFSGLAEGTELRANIEEPV